MRRRLFPTSQKGELTMLKIFVVAAALVTVFSQAAFADYEYRVNKYGTGYFRDSSNDGNSWNNANSIGLNS